MESPILCAPLLRQVDAKLIDLLTSLEPAEWALPTVAPQWTVRDVVAHLLDTTLRKLAMVRDRWMVDRVEIQSAEDVVQLVNRLNHEGVTVYRRLSPPLLIRWMGIACEESAAFHEALDPFAPAAFAVSWAGQQLSPNWFDTARELTERWHHQQQIREAVGRPGIMSADLYHPVLDCFVRGLPYTYRDVSAPQGSRVRLRITGDCGGQWQIRKDESAWTLETPNGTSPDTLVTVPQKIAWRLFTKGISRNSALEQVQIEGDRDLGLPVLQLVAIVG